MYSENQVGSKLVPGRVNKQIRSYVIIPSRQARTHVSICHRNVRRRPAGARRIELPMHMHIAGRVSERRAGRLHTPQKTSEQTHSRECIIRRIVRTRPAHARQRAPVRRTESAEQTALSSAAATQSDRYLLFAHYIIQTARTHARLTNGFAHPSLVCCTGGFDGALRWRKCGGAGVLEMERLRDGHRIMCITTLRARAVRCNVFHRSRPDRMQHKEHKSSLDYKHNAKYGHPLAGADKQTI